MCFDAKTGQFLWQAVHDVLENGQANDWPKEGICSTPAVDGDRVYYVSNRAEVVCADLNGFADGNQGGQSEKYQDATDADILWSVDLIKEYGVFPHNKANCSPLVVGDAVFVCTSNGVDEGHQDIPAPDAPSFLALDKNTGKLLWKSSAPGKNIMHAQWSSPAYAADPVPQVIFPGGDGWLRAFDPPTGRLLWAFDGNPKGTTYKIAGEGRRNDFIGMPVVAGRRVYIGLGQDPDHYTGASDFWCIDLKKAVEKGRVNPGRDVSAAGNNFDPAAAANAGSALAWHFGGDDKRSNVTREFVFGRTMSTACVVDGVVYVAELQGLLHCLDAKTGKQFWEYDTKGAVWGSPYYADGKVFLATESSELFIFRHRADPLVFPSHNDVSAAAPDKMTGRGNWRAVVNKLNESVLIRKIEFDDSFHGTPSVVGGVLYVATQKDLYAIGVK
jgi:outer membrane protein assembly factor BamB